MRKLTLVVVIGIFSVSYTPFVSAKMPFLNQRDKKILPGYKQGNFDDTQRLSIHIKSLINQGRFDKAAQILNILGSQKAAAVLLTMKFQDTRQLFNLLDIKNTASTFIQIAKLDVDCAANLFIAITRSNPSSGARLYEKIAEEEVNLKGAFKKSAVGKKMLISLLTARDKRDRYIISTSSARNLLWDYAKANEKHEWGNIEITALINSGRGAEILFKKLTQKGILQITDEERIKVLLSMKPKQAARIIRDAYPEQAARLLVIMKPKQAALILAQKALKPKELKIIIREMYKRDENITEDIIQELKILTPAKVEIIQRRGLF